MRFRRSFGELGVWRQLHSNVWIPVVFLRDNNFVNLLGLLWLVAISVAQLNGRLNPFYVVACIIRFQSTGVGSIQRLPLCGWCIAHAVFPSCHLRRNLSVTLSITLWKLALVIGCLTACTRIRERLKHLNQLRGEGKVVD